MGGVALAGALAGRAAGWAAVATGSAGILVDLGAGWLGRTGGIVSLMVEHDKRSRSPVGEAIVLTRGDLRLVRASFTRRSMSVRKYSHTDRAELIALWSRVFPDDPPHNAPAKVIDEKLAVDDLIFVIPDKHGLIGACIAGYDGHRGWLYAVAVDPSQRRRGLGRSLVRFAIDALGKRGCGKVNLQIRATNEEVLEFYRALGFVVEERISMGLRLP